jgi:hypothetical protein
MTRPRLEILEAKLLALGLGKPVLFLFFFVHDMKAALAPAPAPDEILEAKVVALVYLLSHANPG